VLGAWLLIGCLLAIPASRKIKWKVLGKAIKDLCEKLTSKGKAKTPDDAPIPESEEAGEPKEGEEEEEQANDSKDKDKEEKEDDDLGARSEKPTESEDYLSRGLAAAQGAAKSVQEIADF